MTSAFDILKNARRGVSRATGPLRPPGKDTMPRPPGMAAETREASAPPQREAPAPVAVHVPDIPSPLSRMRREPAIYRELMKKHDRLGNRHLPKK